MNFFLENHHGVYFLSESITGKYFRDVFIPSEDLPHPSEWSQNLKTIVSATLSSCNSTSSAVMWGPDLLLIYNDGFAFDVLDEPRRLKSFGRPCKEVFPEAWHRVGPLLASVYKTGIPVSFKDWPLPLTIDKFLVERYFTFSYSALPTENGVEGVFALIFEVTQSIVSKRQLSLLTELSSRIAYNVTDACREVSAGLQTNRNDFPFTEIYIFNQHSSELHRSCFTGLPDTFELLPKVIRYPIMSDNDNLLLQGIKEAIETGEMKRVDITSLNVPPCGHWEMPPTHCCVFPIMNTGIGVLTGLLILGCNQMRIYDETYQSFIMIACAQISGTLANAQAHEEERNRIEKLNQFDKAKTVFFSSISHEFKTPISLILGPLDDLMKQLESTEINNSLSIIHRNTLRLLKLVNSLMDFSRIEAGRMTACFVPTDLSNFTYDLASIFKHAFEKEGINYTIHCDKLSEKVYIDQDMWEQIVSNLISNALKYTNSGSVDVNLFEVDRTCKLQVRDTGIGVPEKDISHLFERFFRSDTDVKHYEGTGIGLALVNELVKIHGGKIEVTSVHKKGTTFTVTIPFGYSHLPPHFVNHNPDNITTSGKSYKKSVQWWLPSTEKSASEITSTGKRTKILFVDDNPDMREYVSKLLNQKYDVELAVDGLDGYRKATENPPNLILTDIMMPKLDGYGLLKKLREDTKTKALPIIFLSARAGEDQLSEGLGLGADDYLIKPFSARELLARVNVHIRMSQLRKEAAQLEQSNEAKDHLLAVLSHELRTPLTPVLMIAESYEKNESLPATIRDDISLITRSISLEVKLIDDLLDITKIRKGKLELHMEIVSIHDLVSHTIKLLEHSIDEKNLRLKLQLNASSYWVNGDSSRIQQILLNILSNAIKFTPDKGDILIQSSNEKSKILVTITDSGKGIDKVFLPKLFSSFEQESDSRAFGGLGLGLSISKKLATLHKGSLYAYSEGLGKGATFTLELPTTSPPDKEKKEIEPIRSPELGTKRRILLVEDNKPTSFILKRFLDKLGYAVSLAQSVSEALQLYRSGEYDLVLSDIGLPDGTGYDLIRELKKLNPIPAIALSGFGMDEDKRKSIEAGFDIHLTKPVQIDSLRSAINRVINRNKPS